MPWNPEIYNSFKDLRNKPFYDLLSFIEPSDPMSLIDLGCGTGEQTAMLAERFKNADVLGVDSSAEMLEESAQYIASNLRFQLASIEEIAVSPKKWDLIFSNAALQWSSDHHLLFPNLLRKLNTNGQFVVQMPVQNENLLNKLLVELAMEKPFIDYLGGWRHDSPVCSMDAYTTWLFEAGFANLRVEQRVYPLVANDHETLFNFISGSALIPYMERLDPETQSLFIDAYKRRIAQAFPQLPAIYPFKRLLLYGRLLA